MSGAGSLARTMLSRLRERARWFVRVPSAEARIAGLDNEQETLAGWLTLLTTPGDLPRSWGLPEVAGVVLDGPVGDGKEPRHQGVQLFGVESAR